MTASLFADLRAYYDGHGIGAERFHCTHLQSCKQDDPGFTTAKEAYVGDRFGMDDLPRLVFLSLDSGDDGKKGSQARTIEWLQQNAKSVGVDKPARNLHWYQTHVLALRLLRALKSRLNVDEVHKYFAHTNSAKCCLNLPGRRMAAQRLFENCRPYIPGELEILAPAILVTQGRWARVAVEAGFRDKMRALELAAPSAGAPRLISLSGPDSTLWFHSHHPRYYGRYWKQTKVDWPVWSELVRERFGATGDPVI